MKIYTSIAVPLFDVSSLRDDESLRLSSSSGGGCYCGGAISTAQQGRFIQWIGWIRTVLSEEHSADGKPSLDTWTAPEHHRNLWPGVRPCAGLWLPLLNGLSGRVDQRATVLLYWSQMAKNKQAAVMFQNKNSGHWTLVFGSRSSIAIVY